MYSPSVWLQLTALQGLLGEFHFHEGKHIHLRSIAAILHFARIKLDDLQKTD